MLTISRIAIRKTGSEEGNPASDVQWRFAAS
jgi:hypothetical protein